MKPVRIFISGFLFMCLLIVWARVSPVSAQSSSSVPSLAVPLSCSIAPGLGTCPTALKDAYPGEPCVNTYEEFVKNPLLNHFWALDPEVTTQGRANERARQFIYWTISKSSIDDHPAIKTIWITTRNVTTFLFILVVALFGLGYIVGQQSNFQLKIQVWPSIMKIVMGLLYISFSFAITLFIIQISEILMKFFIENLGGDKLFNIYFAGVSQENNYTNFVGCRDLNYKVQEAIDSEMFLLRFTNVTYYVMGVMLLLRKVLLWFLIFVSPFLVLLMPFVFIRNIGWIWIGVFFQWVFYGPLFALFLGALATIWRRGIPYLFDFSRAGNMLGYIYPTGINITYGGPAQVGSHKLSALNNGNYVDTFAEYVITLVMLWAVTFFPWWLLRIFRDYCCDGIYAMKNVLMSMYDKMGGSPGPKPPSPMPVPAQSNIGSAMKLPHDTDIPMRIKIETIEEIRRSKTEDITKSLNLSMTKITDIAKFETNKQVQQTVRQNIDNLAQPTKAETPAERQKFMNIRTELFNRSIKDDRVAKQMLSSITSSRVEQSVHRQELVKSVPQMAPVTQAISYKVNVSQDKVSSINTSLVNTIASNNSVVNSMVSSVNTSLASTVTKTAGGVMAPAAKITAPQIQTILTSYKQSYNQAPAQVVASISKETGIEKEKVSTVIKQVATVASTNTEIVAQVAQKENVQADQVKKIIAAQVPLVTEPEKNIEQAVSIPSSISLEDYEEVKKMWTEQYEKGEVPVSDNITSRDQWVEQDTVFITNTLNKLMSADEKIKQEGVDDLGYILPIFLINNLKGEELAVYLKAKLEAAKAVQSQREKEKEITERLKAKSKDDEELVDVKKPKAKEAEKTMTMSQEMTIDEGEKPKTSEGEEKTEPEKPPATTEASNTSPKPEL